jgi:hypothetical protein
MNEKTEQELPVELEDTPEKRAEITTSIRLLQELMKKKIEPEE